MSGSWFQWPFSSSKSAKLDKRTDDSCACPKTKTCPSIIYADNMMPNIPNSSVLSQPIPLATERIASSIPKTETTDVWLYPSPQMFYNAMERKGHNPNAEQMDVLVSIHNIVNEQCWQEILKWEAFHKIECRSPTLKRFLGRPDSMSPKARLMSLLGYTAPFDRHDWYVDRCGKEVRYIIDFYSGAPSNNALTSFHLDVRPALTYGGFIARISMAWRSFVEPPKPLVVHASQIKEEDTI